MNFYKPPEVIIEKFNEPLEYDHDEYTQKAPATSTSSLPIQNRDDVYAALQELSHFLVKTEPHSPVPAILDMLIRWKDLPLQDIISQIQNSLRLSHIRSFQDRYSYAADRHMRFSLSHRL